jgi:hypothetical protein
MAKRFINLEESLKVEQTKGTLEQEQQWNLHGYIIGKSKNADRYYWATYNEWIDRGDCKGICWSVMTGKAWLDESADTISLSPWKCEENSDLNTQDDVDKFMGSLPLWEKTKYWQKGTDFSSSGLMDCKTGELITDDKILDIIMPKLGYERVKPVPDGIVF